jgi:ADP-ribosylglycohydrolase
VSRDRRRDRLIGTLLGTALGDALGLPAEGLKPAAIARRFGRVERYHLLGRTGFVSDDTEQSALAAQSLLRGDGDLDAFLRAFRRALLGWFLRLPFGVGLSTLRACFKIALGLRRSGIHSAGNGAAMRAAIVGVWFADRPGERERFGRAMAEVTHLDARAVEGALFVAELAGTSSGADPAGRAACHAAARGVVDDAELGAALDRAAALAEEGAAVEAAAAELKTTGFVVHTVSFAAFCYLRFGDAPLVAIQEAIRAGGDTDSIGAIVGAWMGALHGASALPAELLDRIQDGPFGPSHLRALGERLASEDGPIPTYSAAYALLRNLALYPVVLGHGFRRLIPL